MILSFEPYINYFVLPPKSYKVLTTTTKRNKWSESINQSVRPLIFELSYLFISKRTILATFLHSVLQNASFQINLNQKRKLSNTLAQWFFSPYCKHSSIQTRVDPTHPRQNMNSSHIKPFRWFHHPQSRRRCHNIHHHNLTSTAANNTKPPTSGRHLLGPT